MLRGNTLNPTRNPQPPTAYSLPSRMRKADCHSDHVAVGMMKFWAQANDTCGKQRSAAHSEDCDRVVSEMRSLGGNASARGRKSRWGESDWERREVWLLTPRVRTRGCDGLETHTYHTHIERNGRYHARVLIILVIALCEIGSYDSLADRLKDFRRVLAEHIDSTGDGVYDQSEDEAALYDESGVAGGWLVLQNGSQRCSLNRHSRAKRQMSPWAGDWRGEGRMRLRGGRTARPSEASLTEI